MLARRIGQAEAEAYFRAERDAILLVEQLLSSHAINADRHSNGETVLAHRKRDFHTLEKKAQEVSDLYGVSPDLLSKNDLRNQGMGGAFHGGLTIPVGFALNPKKYALGLARAAQEAGAHIHGRTPVSAISGQTGQYRLQTPRGAVKARQVIIAANGYGRETVPEWIGGRFMPAQSSVIVTRPLSFEEQQAQGWTSGQMAYDTRSLLHYFRLMPDGRFLFGMRGGLRTTRAADQDMRRLIRLDFNRMFPAWRGIDTPYYWSGFVCFARDLTPFAGPVPGQDACLPGLPIMEMASQWQAIAARFSRNRLLGVGICGTQRPSQRRLAGFRAGAFVDWPFGLLTSPMLCEIFRNRSYSIIVVRAAPSHLESPQPVLQRGQGSAHSLQRGPPERAHRSQAQPTQGSRRMRTPR